MSDNVENLAGVAEVTAEGARQYLTTVTEVASGSNPDAALSLLLLAVSEISAVGARLGAMVDVMPLERFEPDVGPDDNVDPLRAGLANMLDGIDEYSDLADPLVSRLITAGSLANDLAGIATALSQGLRHYDTGHIEEALWWWQFSYLSVWGERGAAALRVLHSLLAHLRLDAEEDVVAEAEFDALHT